MKNEIIELLVSLGYAIEETKNKNLIIYKGEDKILLEFSNNEKEILIAPFNGGGLYGPFKNLQEVEELLELLPFEDEDFDEEVIKESILIDAIFG